MVRCADQIFLDLDQDKIFLIRLIPRAKPHQTSESWNRDKQYFLNCSTLRPILRRSET